MRVALISLEPWDGTWRRNQHLARELVTQGLASELVFVEPPVLGAAPVPDRHPLPGVRVVRPRLTVPKRLGGYQLAAAVLRHTALAGIDLVWVNDPQFGVHCLLPGRPAVYDVTDDWRAFDFPDRVRRRLVRAEDRLARTAVTVVCSPELRVRWADRYGVAAALVRNGVDAGAWEAARPRPLEGPGPHVGYLGTLHGQRLDTELVLELAGRPEIGTVHLVGQDALGPVDRDRLLAAGVRLSGPVPAAEVPSWTLSFDVLVAPHRVNDFTRSLDAIKAYEYLAADRPVVATPTSGFHELRHAGLAVVPAERFAAAVVAALAGGTPDGPPRPAVDEMSWGRRAAQFARLTGISPAVRLAAGR